MKQLNETEIQEFEEKGYIFLPSLFTQSEMDALTSQLDDIFAKDVISIVREKNSNAVRTSFAVQTYNPVFARLARHPGWLTP